jgi:putative transposase
MKAGRRRSIRLKDYDYSQAGAYFITVRTRSGHLLFGDIVGEKIHLTEVGHLADACWRDIPHHFPNVDPDEYVVMPNHVHGIVVLLSQDCKGTACRAPTAERFSRPTPLSIPTIVRSFKAAVTGQVHLIHGFSRAALWQRNYYEHVIRDDKSLDRIRNYILTNPLRWHLDGENPSRTAIDEFDVWLSSFHKGPVRRKSDAELSPKSVRIPNDSSRIT